MTGLVRPHVFALLYGDFLKLHERLVLSLARNVPSEAPVWLWLNVVCHDTKSALAPGRTKVNWRTFMSNVNVGKYRAMRQMFTEALKNPNWNWAVWFDDDSHIDKADWWETWDEYVSSRMAEGPGKIAYVGQPWWLHYTPGMWQAVKEAKWFKGKEPETIRDKPAVTFATGGYWWLARWALEKLDWPDIRLNHNGGDHLLAQAVRQQDWPFHKFAYGVKVNDAKRRGYWEPALGDKQ